MRRDPLKKRYTLYVDPDMIKWVQDESDRRGCYTADVIRGALERERRVCDAREQRRALKNVA